LFTCVFNFPEGGQKDSEITLALQYLIVADNLPFDIVNHRGFRRFVKTVAPLYKIPARSTITEKINKTAQAIAAVQRIELGKANNITVTSDFVDRYIK
jgi:hypothetical protein